MKSTLLVLLSTATIGFAAEPISPAVNAINSFGLDLIRATSQSTNNFLISPYSMQSALAMTYAIIQKTRLHCIVPSLSCGSCWRMTRKDQPNERTK